MVTLDELREKHQKLIQESENKGGGTGGNDYAKFTMGSNLVRVLPGKEDQFNFYVEISQHKFQNAEGKTQSFQCRKPHNEACPICDFYFELWERHKALNLGKDSDGKQKKSKFGTLAGKIRARSRYFAKVVVRALQEKGEDPVKFLAMSGELFEDIMEAVTNADYTDNDDPENSTVLSLDKGNDFDIIMSEKGGFNNFEGKAKIKKTKAGKPSEVAEWMENKLDLKSLVKIGEYEEAKKIVAQLEASLNSVSSNSTTKAGSTEEQNDIKFEKEMKV